MENIKIFFQFKAITSLIHKIVEIHELGFIKQQYFIALKELLLKYPSNRYQQIGNFLSVLSNKCISDPKKLIKVLVCIHQIGRIVKSKQMDDALAQALFKIVDMVQIYQNLLGLDKYLKNKFVQPYCQYLIKYFQCQRQEDSLKSQKTLQTTKSSPQNNNAQNLDFTIFNRVLSIIKQQNDFHQMGRYYSEHQYIINLYLQYLKDLMQYFRIIQTNINRISNVQDQNQIEEIYIYTNEAQRIFNKSYSFVYNKYLYGFIVNMINVDSTLELPEKLIKRIKKFKSLKNFVAEQTLRGSKKMEVSQLNSNYYELFDQKQKILMNIATLQNIAYSEA